MYVYMCVFMYVCVHSHTYVSILHVCICNIKKIDVACRFLSSILLAPSNLRVKGHQSSCGRILNLTVSLGGGECNQCKTGVNLV